MGETLQRLRTAASVLELIERRRLETGDSNLGSSIERQLVGRELRELEAEILLSPGPLAKYVSSHVTERRSDPPRP